MTLPKETPKTYPREKSANALYTEEHRSLKITEGTKCALPSCAVLLLPGYRNFK